MGTMKLLLKFICYSKLVVSSFPGNFTLKFEDEEFAFIDLDSPGHLSDRKSNILMVSEPESELSNIVPESNKNHNLLNLACSHATSGYSFDVS